MMKHLSEAFRFVPVLGVIIVLLAILGAHPARGQQGNSAAAHWCTANFPPGQRGQCVSQAAHGTGPFFACGPGGTSVGLCGGVGGVCCAVGNVCAVNVCVTPTPTRTPTATPTNTPTASPTETPPPAGSGPQITLFAIGTKEGCVACSDSACLCVQNGYPTPTPFVGPGPQVFVVDKDSDFTIVVEAKPGVDHVTLPTDPGVPPLSIDHRPNLQIEGHRDMGVPGPTPCIGGIQGIDPPDFGPSLAITSALQSFACQFSSFTPFLPCTLDPVGNKNYLSPTSMGQFCDQTVQPAQAFQLGDTVLTVQLQDNMGVLGPTAQIVVRRLPAPTPTPTP